MDLSGLPPEIVTGAGGGTLGGLIVTLWNKYISDKKIAEIDKDIESLKMKLAEDYLKKSDTLEMLREIRTEQKNTNEMLLEIKVSLAQKADRN